MRAFQIASPDEVPDEVLNSRQRVREEDSPTFGAGDVTEPVGTGFSPQDASDGPQTDARIGHFCYHLKGFTDCIAASHDDRALLIASAFFQRFTKRFHRCFLGLKFKGQSRRLFEFRTFAARARRSHGLSGLSLRLTTHRSSPLSRHKRIIAALFTNCCPPPMPRINNRLVGQRH
jgi:hypothetical protein